MSDDTWSLKGKGWIDIPDLDLTPDEYNEWKIKQSQSLARPTIVGEFKSDKDIKVYPKEVIETLRQKLIEDLEKCLNEKDEEIDKEMKEFWETQKRITGRDNSVGRYKPYHINNSMKAREIVNKRFGKERIMVDKKLKTLKDIEGELVNDPDEHWDMTTEHLKDNLQDAAREWAENIIKHMVIDSSKIGKLTTNEQGIIIADIGITSNSAGMNQAIGMLAFIKTFFNLEEP